MTTTQGLQLHGIKDNHTRGRVADFLSAKVGAGSKLSVVSAYFTIYAYEALSKELDGVESLQFLFGEPPFRLYRYATRLLVERVSWLCRDTRKDNEGDGSCELIFSNRSAMSYEDLRNYLTHLKDKPGTDARIDWTAIHPQKVRPVNHDQLAGLQMADAVASSLFFAVNLTQYSEVEDRYFRMLRPTIYRHPKTGELGYGLKFWPGSLEALTESMEHLVCFTPPK